MSITVVLYDEVHYGFENKPPFFYVKPAIEDTYGRQHECDYAPGYHHDPLTIERELAYLNDVCPLNIPLHIAVFSRDGLGGTNGCYWNESAHHGDGKSTAYGVIFLWGKRIPLHPAMTRYLCAHEYGHGVQYAYERLYGMKPDAMEADYAQTFRPQAKTGYGPGKWHDNIGELIANDFRILIAHKEEEFWPHAGHPRPEDVPGLYEFWMKAQCELRNRTPEGTMFHAPQEVPAT